MSMRGAPQYIPTINGKPQPHLGTTRHPVSATSLAYAETRLHPEKYPEPKSCSYTVTPVEPHQGL